MSHFNNNQKCASEQQSFIDLSQTIIYSIYQILKRKEMKNVFNIA